MSELGGGLNTRTSYPLLLYLLSAGTLVICALPDAADPGRSRATWFTLRNMRGSACVLELAVVYAATPSPN
jgi:hypothetical protein